MTRAGLFENKIPGIEMTAEMSGDRLYRYSLGRRWDGMSTAAAPTPLTAPEPQPPPPVEACVRCGDPGPRVRPGRKPPKRFSAERYGLEGKLCPPCAESLRRVNRVNLVPGKPVKPCVRCHGLGTSSDPPTDPAFAATRFKGYVYGIKGLICYECRRILDHEQPEAVARARAERDRRHREQAGAAVVARRVQHRDPAHPVDCDGAGSAPLVRPCDLCGKPGGAREPGSTIPARYDAREFAADMEGEVCADCRAELTEERDRLKVVRLVDGGFKSMRDRSETPCWEGAFEILQAGPYGLDDVRGPLFTLALLTTYGPALRRALRPVVIPRSEWSAP